MHRGMRWAYGDLRGRRGGAEGGWFTGARAHGAQNPHIPATNHEEINEGGEQHKNYDSKRAGGRPHHVLQGLAALRLHRAVDLEAARQHQAQRRPNDAQGDDLAGLAAGWRGQGA